MRKYAAGNLPEFFYIARARDRSLCGGVATNCGVSMRAIPIWRKPYEYEWARRFATAEKAMEYVTQNEMYNVLIVNRKGMIMASRGPKEVPTHA